ncbi:MAG: gallate dioxygenase, partial [Betaproteobacteria bacterium]|nr:gallate dioxygenase [Betaproteobacteria bacterium]
SLYSPSMTGIASLVLENESIPTPCSVNERHRARMLEQLAGVERLEGTYPFTHASSLKAYRLNKYLHSLIVPAHRETFLNDPEVSFAAAGLSDVEKDLVRRRDWRGMIHYGVIFFMLEKLGAVIGTSNLHIYAAMRGESLEDFMKTRRAKLNYSVAGAAAAKKVDWDT